MNYGLYTAYLGMRAQMRTLEVIANNVANASTTGFKADSLHYRSIEAAELGAARLAAQADPTAPQPDATQAGGQSLAEMLLPSRSLTVHAPRER